jgi:starch synthase (maltosyl-transferring)
MIKVSFLITGLDRGGAERSLVRLVTGLDRARFQSSVFSLSGEGPLSKQLDEEGIPVHALSVRSNPLSAVLRLAKELRAIRPHILQTFLFHANQAGRVAGRMAGVPRIVSSIRVCEVDRPWRTALDRLTQAASDRVTCVAGAVRDFTRRASGIPPHKMIVIPNAVDVLPRNERTPPPTASRVLTIAQLRRQKGIDVLIRAIPHVLRSVPSASFTVVGRGDPTPYKSQARLLGVQHAIRWAGETADVTPYLLASDAFVLPSRWEGCPNVVLEAMSVGLPVVATVAGGTPELVEDGVTGFLVPIEAPETLARRILALLLDPGKAFAMGQAGRDRAASRFSVRAMVKAYETLYEQLAHGL